MKTLLIVAVVIVCLALILGPAVISSVEAAVAKTQSNMQAACANSGAACNVFDATTAPAISAEGGR